MPAWQKGRNKNCLYRFIPSERCPFPKPFVFYAVSLSMNNYPEQIFSPAHPLFSSLRSPHSGEHA